MVSPIILFHLISHEKHTKSQTMLKNKNTLYLECFLSVFKIQSLTYWFDVKEMLKVWQMAAIFGILPSLYHLSNTIPKTMFSQTSTCSPNKNSLCIPKAVFIDKSVIDNQNLNSAPIAKLRPG